MSRNTLNITDLNLGQHILTLVLSQQGHIISANQACRNMLVSSMISDSLAEHDFGALLQRLDQLSQGAVEISTVTLEHRLEKDKSRQIRWQFFADVNKQEIVGIGNVLEAEPKKNFYESQIMDYITDGFFIADHDGQFLMVNQAYANMLGLSQDEVYAKNINDIFGGQQSPLYSTIISRALYKNKTGKYEVYFPQLSQWWLFAVYPTSDQVNIVYCKEITERKKNEIQLSDSRSKLEAILDSTSEAHLLLSPQYQILSFNKSAQLFVGKIFGSVLVEKASVLQIIPDSAKASFQQKFERTLAGETIHTEWETQIADHSQNCYQLTFSPLYDAQQKVVSVAINAFNITDRKYAEEQLRMYSLIVNHITDTIIVTDAQGRTRWVNESFVRKTGYSLDDMYGLKPGEVLQGPDTSKESALEMHNAVVEGRGFHVDIINYTKSGRPYHVEIKADPFYSTHGELQGFIAIQPDITQRKKEEETRLRESWTRFHAIFENSINAILLADDQGRYLDANPAACEISGYSLDEIRQIKLNELLDHASELNRHIGWDEFIIKGKMEGTVAIRTKAGHIRILDYKAMADILPGIHLSILSDVTDQYQAEKKIRKQNKHLKKLNEEKNQLFSIIAHDLRSPLNGLSAMIQLLQDESIEKEDFDQQIGFISQRINHSLNLMDNLFQWAQHQLKGIKMEKQHFDLHEVTETKLGLFKDIADKKKITITNQIPKNTIIHADLNMIDLVIRNLVANATKFCDEGDQIHMMFLDKDEQVQVCISDTGKGIKADHLPKIFDGKFTTPGTKKEKGSGLGLRICKDFVEQHDGQIWVESKWGEGSHFCFMLPKKQFTPNSSN